MKEQNKIDAFFATTWGYKMVKKVSNMCTKVLTISKISICPMNMYVL